MAAAAAMSRDSFARTADEGDSNDREKNRDAENQCSIHPRILQLQVPGDKITQLPSKTRFLLACDGRQARSDILAACTLASAGKNRLAAL